MKRAIDGNEAERELMEAQAALLKTGAASPQSDCPSDEMLRRFATGREVPDEVRGRILVHLAACSRCLKVMAEAPRLKIARPGTRRGVFRKSIVAVAATIIVALVLWIWSRNHAETTASDDVAEIDLRLISPTRGVNPDFAVIPARVSRHAGHLRLLLPVRSEGVYQAGIFRKSDQGSSLLRDSANTSLEDHTVTLSLKFSLAGLKPGTYWLGLCRDGSAWKFYPVFLE